MTQHPKGAELVKAYDCAIADYELDQAFNDRSSRSGAAAVTAARNAIIALIDDPVRAAGPELLAADAIHSIVVDAMQTAWDEICRDTECCPLDIERGRRRGSLTFKAAHWADFTGDLVVASLRAAIARAEAPADAEGGDDAR